VTLGGGMHSIKILVVDDDNRVRTATINHLTKCNDLEVVGEASNGVEAIAKFKAISPDVVLLDISMPVMNGIEAAKTLLAKDRNARIIILSAMLTPIHLDACRSVGVVDCIPKEKLHAELIPAIRRAAVHM
jgi:two-component system, chemotaxis family, chemotaxis protein CheY